MALWSKTPVSGFPKYVPAEDKKYIIATKQGWVKRVNSTGVGSASRVREEILIAENKIQNALTIPNITSVYVANTTGGTALKRNQVNRVFVSYSKAISIAASASPRRLNIANTIGGNTVIATSNTTVTSIINANNTLVFKFKVATAGTYKIQAQNISNTAQHKVYDVLGGTTKIANANISATVSNTLSTFVIS
jgi:hypothetical protein